MSHPKLALSAAAFLFALAEFLDMQMIWLQTMQLNT